MEIPDQIIDFLRWVQNLTQEAQAIMRKNGFAFTDLDDRWQKLGFTFYSSLAEASTKAERLLEWIEEYNRD